MSETDRTGLHWLKLNGLMLIDFLSALDWSALPPEVQDRAPLTLLDLCGIAVAGTQTDLSRIICDHTASEFGGDRLLWLDGRKVSTSGQALALGMTIDALDGHDGFNPAKGHIGACLLPGLLALATPECSGQRFLAALAGGYEVGARLAVTLHDTAPDYHTSGAWGAVNVALMGAWLRQVSAEVLNHAAGIAEYHGPRSQMMRCIDHPTMLKDGAGWGAMAGVSALTLAVAGFTGAPALTTDGPAWHDLGDRWLLLNQYHKPYPVCRWAQPAIEGVLSLKTAHGIEPCDIKHIEIETFHEATRLAVSRPISAEAAQYSTSFPTAVAMVHGDVRPEHLDGAALTDPRVLRLSEAIIMVEDDQANAAFPGVRKARVALHLRSGQTIQDDWREARWEAADMPNSAEIRAKFHALADPVLGEDRAERLENAVFDLARNAPLSDLTRELGQPISRATTAGKSR